jgi:hypothetical protein
VMIETKFKMLVMNLAYWSDIDAHQVTKWFSGIAPKNVKWTQENL